jgi:tetratricopeptide (TPR) repeat protein
VLVGRERQVRQLCTHIEALATGRGGLLLLAGEAGAGKTRLAEEALLLAGHDGVDAHRVTCWAEAGAPPFWPWSQLLRELGAEPLDATTSTRDDADREIARFQLFSTVSDALLEFAAERPRLLVIDDMHCADPPSVRLLAFLAPRLRDAAILVVATYRDSEVDGPSDLGATLPELIRHGRQVVVPPLEHADLGTFVTDLVGAAVPDDLVTRLHELTAGNPLFAREVVSLLEAKGAFARPDGTAELPLPESVRATLARRLDTVSDACREVLGVASVVGVDFGVDVVAATASLDNAALLPLLDEAEVARLVGDAGGGRFTFTHPLIRETAYRELGLARRVRLHADVADALERLADAGVNVDAAALAHHFRMASPSGNAAKAVGYAELAAARAMTMLAYEAAVTNCEHALETLSLCPPDAAREADLLLQLGEARLAVGDLPRARTAFEHAAALARREGWAERLARAALGCGSGASGFEVPPFDEAQIALLRESLDGLGTAHPATRSLLLARLSVAMSLVGTEAKRLALADEAVALARSAGDERALAYALAAHCDAIAGPDFCEHRVDEAAEIVAIARAHGDARGELLGRRLRVLAFAELGLFVEMDAEVDAYARLADAIRQPLYTWYVPLWRAMRALMEGRFEDAAEWCTEAEAIGASAHSENAEMLTMTLRLAWLIFAEQYDEARTAAEGFAARFPGLADMLAPSIGCAAARQGDLEQARTVLSRIDVDEVFEWGAERLPALAYAGEMAGRVGDVDRAARYYDLLVPYRDLWAIDGIAAANLGSIERVLALLASAVGRRDVARAHFERALAQQRRSNATLLVAGTQRDVAQIFGRGDIDAAPLRSGAWTREGEVWALSYDGRTVRLRHTKGIGDLARLLEEPGREIHVLDLASDGRAAVVQGDTGPKIDSAARDAYKRRLVELDADLEAADADADAGRSQRLHAEREALLAELSGAYGLGGRARRTGDAAERARSAVTQRIRDALSRIDAEHTALGSHLRRTVRTGVFCVYEGDGTVEWDVTRAT